MAGIITNVDSDVQKLRKLKNEIEEVKKALKGINIKVDVDITKGMEEQLKSLTDQYNALVTKVAEAEGKILLSTKRINDASEKIIKAQENLSKVTGVTAQPLSPNMPSSNASETASIQLQAKAYDELRDEIDSVIGTRSQNIKRMIEESNAIRLINAEIKKITKSQGESSTLSSAQQRRLEQLNNSLLTHKTALSEVRQNLSNNVKLDNVAATSMNGLSQSLSRMRMTYRELTEEERKSPFGKELLASINQADIKIKELDSTIGNHQRNVGNYGKQWNGLSISIQQVGRELPSLAYGPKVFFSAISNNLPILADEIKRARIEYDLLKKSGQSATPVWKQIISSLFSWQTALTIGITLLTLYGDKVVDWVTSLIKAKNTIKEMLSAEHEMALARKNAVSNSIKERTELDFLYKKLRDTTLSTKERNAAVNEWMKKHPQHSNIMNGEIISLGKLESAYQLLSKQIVETAKARAYSDKITELTKEREEAETRRLNSLNTLERSKAALAKNGSDLQKTITKNAQKQYDAIAQEVEQYDKKIAQIQKKIKVDDLFPQPQEGTYDYWQQQVQIADTSLKQIKEEYLKVLKSGNKEKINLIPEDVKNQYNKAIALKTRAEKALSVYDTSSKQESEAEKQKKEREAALKAEAQRQEELLSLRRQNQQDEINLMNDGSDKKLKQIELDYQKEIDAIKKQEKAWSSEQGGKLTQEQSVEISTRYTNADSKRDKSIADVYSEQMEKYKDLLSKYQDYTDQRLEIEKKFNDDIAVLQEARKKAEKQDNVDEVARIDRSISKAIAEKGKELMRHDFDVLKQSPEYIRAFEDLRNTSSETLNSLLSQLENAKQTAAQTLNPKDLREYTTTIQEIMDELDTRNPFKALVDRQTELAEAERELADAKKQLDAVNGGSKIVTGVKSTSLGKDGKIRVENTYLTAGKALEKYNAAKDKAQKVNNTFIKAEESAKERVDELGNAIKGIGDSIGGTSGEIISLIGDVALFTTGTIDGITKVAQTGANAMSAVEKASVILGIISAGIQLMQQLNSILPTADNQYEKFAEKVAEINKLTDAVNEYRIAALEAQQAENNWFSDDNLKNLRDYKKLHDEVAEAYKNKAKESQAIYQNKSGGGWFTNSWNWILDNTYGKLYGVDFARKYEEGQIAAINNLRIETRSRKKGFLGSGIGGRSQKTEDLVSWARNNGLGELFDNEGLINKEAANAILNQYGDKLVGQTKETLESLIELREKYDEYIEQLHEYVSSLYEPLVNNFVDSIWDWLDSGKDALNSFRDYASDTFRDIANDMLKSIVISKIFGEGENSYQNKVNRIYDDYAKGLIDEVELNRQVTQLTGDLMKNAENQLPAIQGMAENISNTIKNTTGIDITGSSTSQSSSQKGFTAMSQDTGEELNGRFTALQIAGEEIKNQNALQTQSLNILTVKADAILSVNTDTRNIADEIRTIQVNSYLELQEIRENTGAIVKPIQQMQKDIAEVKKNTKGLS